jgi:hypothetical protein
MSYGIPDSFVDLVRRSHPAITLKLLDDTILLLAEYLFAFQNSKAAESMLRDAHNKKNQERRIKALMGSAKDTENRLREAIVDPVLSELIKTNYQGTDSSIPHRRRTKDGEYVDVFMIAIDNPPDTYQALIEVCERLGALYDALEFIKPQSSQYPTNKKTQETLLMLVTHLNDVISPFVDDGCSKSGRVSHICDFLSLIDIDITDKTILNLL